MRVFASELLSSGAWTRTDPPDSLMREGRAMIEAVLADLSVLDGVHTSTVWSANLKLPNVDGVEITIAPDPESELAQFRRLAAESDFTLVIAPEIDGVLARRRRIVESVGGRCLGPTPNATEQTADKLRLPKHLLNHGVPAIPAERFAFSNTEYAFPFPIVVKPRFGAGSQGIRCYARRSDLVAISEGDSRPRREAEWIVQPLTPGRALSVAAIIRGESKDVDVFPACEQRLSDDGRFRYLGGRFTDEIGDELQTAVENLVRRTCSVIGGLRGYVGFDLIVPQNRPLEPIIVEVNPRLTTSYLGYRALTPDRLAERFLYFDRPFAPIQWNRARVRFDADGRIETG